MNYQYHETDPQHCATNLRYREKDHCLLWDIGPGQSTLIVRTGFKESAVDKIEETLSLMNDVVMPGEGRYQELENGTSVRIITAAEKAQNNGCPIEQEACSYTVFCVMQNNEEQCIVYEPQMRGLPMYTRDVPMQMQLRLEKDVIERKVGLFGRRTVEEETGYYVLYTDPSAAVAYHDGDVYYEMNGINIPITRQIIEAQQAYIWSQDSNGTIVMPKLQSRNPGLKLTLKS